MTQCAEIKTVTCTESHLVSTFKDSEKYA